MSKTFNQQGDLLLTTKLNPPLIRSDILERPHLIEKLESEIRRPLTVISATAGYGKSTLAAQWLKTSSLPGVWVSLDKDDRDARVFLSYLVAAVQRLEPLACSRIRNLLEASIFPPSEILAKFLANDLEEISMPFLLVLDDYHLASSPEVNDIIDRLLKHPPRSLHLVIVTRRDPPFMLVTMNARGMLVEIREADLQFDTNETTRLLESVGDIRLDKQGLARIVEDIEGWITGLRLYCLAAVKGGSPEAYLFGTGGVSTSVQDYMVEQVLSGQSPEMQDYLLMTSILDRFCASLCEAVCSTTEDASDAGEVMNGQLFMQTITEAKLFGIQLEAEGEWIRYHHLFQELLRNRLLSRQGLQDITALHRKAAKWFVEQGLVEEALKHALLADDIELAVDIIEDARFNAINFDRWARLGRWLDALPAGVEESRPHLLMSRAYLLVHSTRDVQRIPTIIERVAELAGEPPADPMLAGELLFFRGIPLLRMGQFEESGQLFRGALRILPEKNEEGRSLSEMYTYLLLHLEGQSEMAVQGLKTAIQRNQPQSLHYQGRLVFGLSYVHALAGHWSESYRAAEHLVSFSQPAGLSFAVAWGEYMQGLASLQMLDLEQADRCFSQSLERRYIKNPQAALDGLVGHAMCKQLQGKQEEADECLREAREFAYWTGDPARIDVVDSAQARVDLLRGDVDSAARWLVSCQWKPDVPIKMFFLEFPEMTSCRVLVAKGTAESLIQVAPRLESLELESRQYNHDCQLLPLLVLKSLLALKEKRFSEALSILKEAVNLAWPRRWMLPFIEGGPLVAELLQQLREDPEWGGFVSRILACFPVYLSEGAENPAAQQAHSKPDELPIIDLTNREIDVLELLCERLYDKEIAKRLFISPATVKTHLSHIYSKLEVTSRREAVKKARQQGLV